MELWIRSQDKTRLTKVNDLYVVGYGNDWAIDGYYINSVDDFDLGIYSTKERALEVLDEIQQLIEDLQYMSYAIPNDKFTAYRPNVYEMSKE